MSTSSDTSITCYANTTQGGIARRFAYLVALAAALLALPGCSHRGDSLGTTIIERPALKKIALVPVLDPPSITIENRGSAWSLLALPGYVIEKNIQKDRAAAFTATLRNHSLQFGPEMSSALKEELARAGFEVMVLTEVKRYHDDPDSIVYEDIEVEADAILTARYYGVGLYSAQFSTDYVPRLNFGVDLVRADDQEYLYSQTIYYGADARETAEDQIPAKPQYAYGSFANALERQDEIVHSYREGIRAVAALVADQVRQGGF